ncbi:MAG: hypothetical protein ACREQQ_00125 [Candidatus Binatia bacterium]
MSPTIALIVCFALPHAALAADTLADLLEGVQEAERTTAPLRADATAEIEGIKGVVQDRLVIVERAAADGKIGKQVSVQLEKAKLRLLALGPADLHLAVDGKAKKAAPDSQVAETSWTVEDFLPFSRSRCAAVRIADISDAQATVVCEPERKVSQYALMVYKFDREKFVTQQVLLYKDTMTNLVKMLRKDDYEQVGSKWRPKRIVMQDFKLRTKDTFALEWQPSPGAPAELFDAKTFATAPPLFAAPK